MVLYKGEDGKTTSRVGDYAADKEVRRWVGNPEPSRNGALFVYLWLIFFMAAFVVRYFRPEYSLPTELSPVILQVLGIFFGSRASKQIEGKLGVSGRSANPTFATRP